MESWPKHTSNLILFDFQNIAYYLINKNRNLHLCYIIFNTSEKYFAHDLENNFPSTAILGYTK